LLANENAFGCVNCTRQFIRQKIKEMKELGIELPKHGERKKISLMKKEATKQFLIDQPPEVLTIHLKRFCQTSQGLFKIGKFVKFETTLDLSPYCSNPGDFRYKLSGVVIHDGSMGGGHYTAHFNHRDTSDWHYFSDSSGHHVDLQEVLSSHAYMLFYDRIRS